MTEYAMPPESARKLLTAFDAHGVAVCVGGGWAVDALVGRPTRRHADLDVWVDAADTEGLFAAFVDEGVDRIHPWPGDRPWNFVLHDGHTRRAICTCTRRSATAGCTTAASRHRSSSPIMTFRVPVRSQECRFGASVPSSP